MAINGGTIRHWSHWLSDGNLMGSKSPNMFLLVCAASLLVSGCLCSVPSLDTETIAVINGERISSQEFITALNRNRNKVVSHFRLNYEAEYGNSFWDNEWQGINPLAFLKTISLDDLLRKKVEVANARDFGLIKNNLDPSIPENRVAINKKRSIALSNDQVIYGPQEYSESVFSRHYYSLMVISLKDHLAKNIFNISDKALNEFYKSNKMLFSVNGSNVEYRPFSECRSLVRSIYIDQLYDQYITDQTQQAEYYLNNKVISYIRWTDSGFSNIGS